MRLLLCLNPLVFMNVVAGCRSAGEWFVLHGEVVNMNGGLRE